MGLFPITIYSGGEAMSNHKFVHVELSCQDMEEAKKFYGSVFDWQFTDFPDMNYVTFQPAEGELGGGFNPVSDENPAGTVTFYIHTDDLEETKNRIKSAGGVITLPAQEIPGVGTIAFFKDPTGNHLAILEPSSEM